MLYIARRLTIIAAAFFLSAVPALAQEMTDIFTTSGGLSVEFSDKWEASETHTHGFTLVADSGLTVYVEYGEAAVEQFGGSGSSASAAEGMDIFLNFWKIAEGTADVALQTELSLPNGNGLFQPGIAPTGTHMFVVTLNLPDDTFIMALAGNENSAGPIDPMMQAEVLAILGSISFDESAVFEDPATMSDETTETSVYIPDDAIAIDSMPEGVVQFNSGAEIQYPDGWMISNVEPYVRNTASLLYGESIFDYSAMVVIMVNDSESVPLEMYRDGVLSIGALMYTGHENFDPARDLLIEVLEDGRTMQSLITSEETGIYGNNFFITLDEQYWAHFIATIVAVDEVDERMAEIEEMVRGSAIYIPEGMVQEPVTLEDGSAVIPEEADCYTVAVNTVDNPVFVFDCPSGCAVESASVWGTDIYTADSGVCAAAIHAGVITNADGGIVMTTWQPGQESYASTERNGVTTIEYGGWYDSFSVSSVPQP